LTIQPFIRRTWCSASLPCGAIATVPVAINRGEDERAALRRFFARVAAGLWPGGLPINLPAKNRITCDFGSILPGMQHKSTSK